MKNTSLFRRILSVVLVVAMVLSVMVPSISAEQIQKATGTSETRELDLVPIDPGTLESRQQSAEKETNEETAHRSTDVVRVSIVLEKASTLDAGFKAESYTRNPAARAYRAGLREEQKAMTAKIEKVIGGKLDVKWNLTLAANNISANVLYGQIEAIKAIDGVKDVFLENRYEPQVDEKADEPNNGAASYMIGSNITWANGYTGAGSKVAVIDTGIDSEHQSFSGEALEYALAQTAEEKGMSYDEYVASLNLLTADKIDAVKGELNAAIGSGAAAYRNTKIAYGYNYVDKRVDYIEHMQDSQGEHGSHVEGIAAANRFIKVDGEFVPALQAVGTQGVAPDAQIVVMKVFGIGGGAYDSDYIVAIEDAIVLGCDSANLSLGSGSTGFSFSSGYEDTMNKLVENGTVVAFSAGNSGMWYDTPNNSAMGYPYLYIDDVNYATGGSPGSFTNSLTVASVDNMGQTGRPLVFGDRHVFYSETSGYGNSPIATIAGREYEYVLVDGPGVDDNDHVGQEGDQFMAIGSEVLTGKIAMCYRGSSSFFAKANAAVAQGAVGVIIINNADGVINMNLTGYNYTAPAVSILKADGDAIKAASEKVEGDQEYYTGTMSISGEIEVQVPEVTDTVSVSSFSSYGPAGTLGMKPEILAPGGSIYSVWGANASTSSPTQSHTDYEVMSGTSMASPQVAGMAAVMGQYIRDNDLCAKTGLSQRQLINSLLMSTAHPVFDEDGEYWSTFRVGSGLGNVADATAAKSYILMDENATLFPDTAKDGKVKVELGDDPDCIGEYEYSFTVYPMEGSKSFTLRTDLFTQAVAGNAGYGMLQYTGTMGIGSVATYEVNGEIYEDTYALDADVNMDGETDEADAQAILDKLTGELAEDAAFDEAAADVDGDGVITTVDARLILESAATPVITITEPTKVTVNLKIDEGWKALLLGRYFTKGFFVEGYTYVDPVADEEGVLDVVHSIPILGYCGSWTDPAMLDRSSAIDVAYGTAKEPYVTTSRTSNYMSVKDADGDVSTYMGNPYMIEDEFPVERLALNSETTINAFNYLNIRNVATLGFAIQDAEGKVLFAQATPTQKYSAYYYVNGGTWQNTTPANYNVGKKLASAGVQEGDVITVGFYALPEYYGVINAKENGQVAATGSLDTAGLTAIVESGILGDGAGIKYTVTVDNTAPEVKGALMDLITGDITIRAQDNRYVAYVAVMNKSGSKIYMEGVPEQTGPNELVEVPLELPEGVTLPKGEVVLLVGDYAGNESAFKVNLGGNGEEEDNGGLMIGFVPAGSTAAPGSGNRAWEIDKDALWYNHSNGTYAGLSNYANVDFTVTAAEYVDGYVFMAADDGNVYAAELGALDEASRVGSAIDAGYVYDMAFNYTNNNLYLLGDDNTVYKMHLITGELTEVAVVTLDGNASGKMNRLAIDDNGVFYTACYGGPSAAKLYKFTLEDSTYVPEDPNPGEDPVVPVVAAYTWDFESGADDWTFVDADGDGYNWTHYQNLDDGNNHNAHSGTCMIYSESYHNNGSGGGDPLTPDNWAISPAIDLSEVSSATLSVWACGLDPSYAAEHFALYAGTSADPDEMTQVLGEQIAGSDYVNYTADLADFVGEEAVYVAIRHFNITDMFILDVDDVEILTEGEAPVDPDPEDPDDPPATGEDLEPVVAEITAEQVGTATLGAWNYSNGGAMAWDHDNDLLYLASNYNATQDYDHYLWIVDTETGVAAKANSVNGAYSARLYGSVRGLFIVPGNNHLIYPTDIATGMEVEPGELNIFKGQTAEITVTLYPWTLTNKDVTWESADPAIATVKDGVVTGVEEGETVVTVTSAALSELGEPHVIEIPVTVSMPPEAEIRGIIWDENGKGQASVFNSNATQEWTALSEVGQLRWGALVGDTVYGSTDDTMYAFDADTYEVTQLGGIVSMWIPSDACELPEDFVEAFAAMGYNVGSVIGPNNNGTYLTMLDPEAGSLIYFNLGDTVFGSDPMATFTGAGRGVYDDGESTDENGATFYGLTESGELYLFTMNHEGSIMWTDLGNTGLDLSGVADATNSVWASTVYDAENEFLYLSLYNGADEYAHLYAIDVNDLSRVGETGNFNADVWPVTGLYEYEPATDLVLKVKPESLVLFEGETAELNIKVKLGETNEYTVEVADENVCTFADGVVTAVKEGETTITVTTVDVNEAGEHLSKVIPVKVKGFKSVDIFVNGQVTDENGARFTKISLDGAVVSKKGVDAPGNVTSGTRAGDLYVADIGGSVNILDAATYEPNLDWNKFDAATYAQYPALDFANYPTYRTTAGVDVDDKVVMTTSVGWLVRPDYYGWNISSFIADMAGVAFGGLEEMEDGTLVYDYYILGADGTLYFMAVDFVNGRRTDPQAIFNTGIVLANPTDASMTFVATAKVNPDGSISEDEYENAGLVIADNGSKKLWYLDFMAEEEDDVVGLVGIMDVENVSGLYGTFDELDSVADIQGIEPFDPGPEPEDPGTYPEPAEGFYNPIVTWDFNDTVDGWTFFDRDADGNNWIWTPESDYSTMAAYEGAGMILSQSYINGTGALNPDNFAISPAINLADYDNANISFWAKGQDPSYADEVFAVYAGTSAEVGEMVKISENFTATGAWTQYTASLADFAGEEEVYVAIRHYSCTDMYFLDVDYVEVLTEGGEAPPEPVAPVYEWSFENTTDLTGWTLLSNDSDTSTWERYSATGVATPTIPETGYVLSATYNSAAAVDDLAITPALDFSELSNATLSFWVMKNSTTWNENYAVYAGTSANFEEMEELVPETATVNAWTNVTVDLADYAGEEEVYIAFRHTAADNQFRIYLDAVEITTIEEEEPAEPFETVLWDFEDETLDDQWTIVDVDGQSSFEINTTANAYSGGRALYCYYGDHPNDWAISPAVDLSNAVNPELSVYGRRAGSSDYYESFQLYAGTSTNVDEMTKVLDTTELSGAYSEYVADLAEFAGEPEVYVAVRYCNSPDMYGVYFDDVSVREHTGEDGNAFKHPAAPASFKAVKLENTKLGDGYGRLDIAKAEVSNEMMRIGETANEVTGGTTAIRGELTRTPVRKPVDETVTEKGTVQIVLTEDVAVTNGLFTVTYDAEALSFVDAVSTLPYKSIHHEIVENKGVITIAYASVEEIAAGETLATLNFTYPDNAIDTTVAVKTLERNDEVAVEEEELEIEVKFEHIHDYGEPEWTWAEDFSAATATFTCECGDVQTVEAVVTTENVDASCTEAGKIIYTAAAVFEETEYTDVKEVEVEALGHTPAEPVKENETEPSCTEDGGYDEVVYCSVCGEELSREHVVIPATGHSYGEPEWIWSDDNMEAIAKFTCENCGDVQSVEAEVEMEIELATCTEPGKTSFIATVEFEDEIFTDVKEETTEALGHVYGEPEWTWTEDFSAATVSFTCSRCGDVQTVEAVVTTETVDASCTEAGKTVYTAVAVFEETEYTDVKEVEIPATGHIPAEPVKENEVAPTCTEAGSYDEVVYCSVCGVELSRETKTVDAIGHAYGEPEWTWTEENTASVKFVCANCGDEQIVEAVVSSETFEPTCTEAGKTVYTAVATFEEVEYTDTKEIEGDPALGHSYGEPEWTWTEDFTATAKFVCSVCGDELVLDAEVSAHYYDTKTVYTAVVTLDETEYTDVVEGPALDPNTYILTDVLKDGDQVVIYNPGYGKGVSNADFSAEQPSYRAGVDVVPEGDKIVNPEDAIVWTVQYVYDAEGNAIGVNFVDAEGHKLSMAEKGLELDKANDVWEIRDRSEEDFTKNLVNVNATPGSQGDPKAMEWYAKYGEFSTHYLNANDGQFIFELYAKVELEPECKIPQFVDLEQYPHGDPVHEAIEWAFLNGITSGTDDTHFTPEKEMDRKTAMTFLYAAAGKPEFDVESAEKTFSDVKPGKWYAKAILWAANQNPAITSGNPDGTFGINTVCKTGHMLTFLYAQQGRPEYDETAVPEGYVADGKWYTAAAKWAYAEGIYRAEGDKFNQNVPCTRATTVLYIYRALTGNALAE